MDTERWTSASCRMAAPRRSRRRPGAPEPDPFSPVQWPLYREQQALQAALEPAELSQARRRCQTLLEHGYGALEDWLLSDPTPAERQRMKVPPRAPSQGQALLDVFG